MGIRCIEFLQRWPKENVPPYLKPDPARAARLAEPATAAAIKVEIPPEQIPDEIGALLTNCSKCSFVATSSDRVYSDHFDTGNP